MNFLLTFINFFLQKFLNTVRSLFSITPRPVVYFKILVSTIYNEYVGFIKLIALFVFVLFMLEVFGTYLDTFNDRERYWCYGIESILERLQFYVPLSSFDLVNCVISTQFYHFIFMFIVLWVLFLVWAA